MKAMTLTAPWSGLVASGVKLIENRPRKIVKASDFGTPFAIHASREFDERALQSIYSKAPELEDAPAALRGLMNITSAIVGIATIERELHGWDEDSIREHETTLRMQLGDQFRWFFGPIGYVLRDVITLPTPVPCKGALGFWKLPDDVEEKVRSQIPAGWRGAPT